MSLFHLFYICLVFAFYISLLLTLLNHKWSSAMMVSLPAYRFSVSSLPCKNHTYNFQITLHHFHQSVHKLEVCIFTLQILKKEFSNASVSYNNDCKWCEKKKLTKEYKENKTNFEGAYLKDSYRNTNLAQIWYKRCLTLRNVSQRKWEIFV